MKSPIYWFCFFLWLLPAKINSQCLTINTAEQVKVCSSEKGELLADTDGKVLSAEWKPAKGLLDPFQLNAVISAPFDTTYQLKVNGFRKVDNLLVNGDFNSGSTGFTSDYTFNSSEVGGYVINKIGTQLTPNNQACKDHTSSQIVGNMMMVKAGERTNEAIYCQEVDVLPNQAYHFEAFATSLVQNNPATLVIKINEETIVETTIPALACKWGELAVNWQSMDNAKAEICIFLHEDDLGKGTDFALDDIGFYEICEATKTVNVEVARFEVTVATEQFLPCGDSIQLAADVFPGDIFFLTDWVTTDGNIAIGERSLNPTIDEAGTYELSAMTNIDGQSCSLQAVVEVIPIIKDSLSIASPDNLNCNQGNITLTPIDQVDRADYLYQWTTVFGNITTPIDLPIIQVDQQGLYHLERTSLFGDCPTFAEVMVEASSIEDFSFRMIPPSCEQVGGMIIFEEIRRGEAPFLYSINGGDNFSEVAEFSGLPAGDYALKVQDANGCEVSKTTTISDFDGVQLTLPSQVRVKSRDTFQLPLTINLADSLITNIEWSPAIGLSCTDCVQPHFNKKSNQQYTVTVSDKNNCVEEAMIDIEVYTPSDVYIPTAFSPNQDGQNDVFQILVNPQMVKQIKRLAIYDRYGNQLFSRVNFLPADASNAWNGQYKGENMPVGVYVYWAELELANGRQEVFSGEVSLFR